MCLMVYYKYINSIRGTLDKGEYLSKSIIIGVSTIEFVIIISYAQKPPINTHHHLTNLTLTRQIRRIYIPRRRVF